jgi:flagellar basal-body rod modification protein FlgD
MPISSDTFQLSPQQLTEARRIAREVNSQINPNSADAPNELGKESFLRLLVTELRHQDPTRPMEDREFIAQMAQFSSLEQMRNINTSIANLLRSSQSAEAYNLIGKEIEAFNPNTDTRVTGVVTSVKIRNNEFFLMVGNAEVALSDIQQVHGSSQSPEEEQ